VNTFRCPQGSVTRTVVLRAPFGSRSVRAHKSVEQARRLREYPLPGFRPSSRHHRLRPHFAKHPKLRFVPSSGFRSLSTVYSAIGSRAYFIPLPRLGSRSSRGFSLGAATLPHREELPPCRWFAPTDEARAPYPSRRTSTSRPYFRAEQRSSEKVINQLRGRSPHRVSSSSRICVQAA
jgi:hypothetical protein